MSTSLSFSFERVFVRSMGVSEHRVVLTGSFDFVVRGLGVLGCDLVEGVMVIVGKLMCRSFSSVFCVGLVGSWGGEACDVMFGFGGGRDVYFMCVEGFGWNLM